ncbi:MAG: DotA/TraY family protein [Candidatus Berkiella sp.]
MIKRNLFLFNFEFMWLTSMFVLMVLPELAFAADPGTLPGTREFSWTSPAEDRSIFYLGQVFGNVGTALQGAGNSMIRELFRIFNIAVLSLGSIVVSYTIVLSTINTAQEGEVMGRKWSSVWIPLRAAIGMGFLLPTSSGYSLIQVMMMQIVIYGIAAANQIWLVATDMAFGGPGVFGEVKILGTSGQRATAMRELLKIETCVQTILKNPACVTAVGSPSKGAKPPQPVSEFLPSGNLNVKFAGAVENTGSVFSCGTMSSAGGTLAFASTSDYLAKNATGIINAANKFQYVAEQIATNATPSAAALSDAADAAAGAIDDSLRAIVVVPPSSAEVADAKKNGWIFAGSYYFDLIKIRNSPEWEFPTGNANKTGVSLASECESAISANMLAATKLLPSGAGGGTATVASSLPNLQLRMQRSSVDSNAGPLYDIIADAVQGATVDLMNTLTRGAQRPDGTYPQIGDPDFTDPVSAMRNMGSSIMTTCENIWFGIILAAFLMLILGCIMSGINPLCWALGAIVTVLVPILTLIIGLLWGAGAAIGIYLPMVPYLVFTFTALGWFLLVIETMAAAPIVALGLVSPAQENLGKASASVMLITNVFLRPSLMVIGFIVAVKLASVAITMVNFGFTATVQAATGNIGIFGCIALLCLYGGLCIGVIHECFSLVHVLPDKITRWIGGQAESSGSNIEKQLGEAKGSVEKGAEIGGGLMKSSAGAASKVAKQSMGGGGITDIASG